MTDRGWEEILIASVRVLPTSNPLSSAFMTMLHDNLPMPRPDVVAAAVQKLVALIRFPLTYRKMNFRDINMLK